MFEKYSENARNALFFARYEASKLGSRVIDSEHLLLGILRGGDETVVALLGRFRLKPDDLRREIEGERVLSQRVGSNVELPLAEETKRALAYAVREAEALRHDQVGPEHLLLGLLRVESSAPARPKGRSMPPTSSSRPCRAARSPASGPRRCVSTASTSRKTARSCGASRRSTSRPRRRPRR